MKILPSKDPQNGEISKAREATSALGENGVYLWVTRVMEPMVHMAMAYVDDTLPLPDLMQPVQVFKSRRTLYTEAMGI